MKPSPNVNLSNLKLQLGEAVLEQELLQDKLKYHDISNATQTNVIHDKVDTLKDNLDYFSDDYLQRAKIKRLKLEKHKAWKKRHKERLKAQRQEQKSAPTLLSAQAPPTITSVLSPTSHYGSKDKATQLQPQKKKQHRKKVRRQQRIQQLVGMVEKLVQLRDLRRGKLEAKGHFFPETGDVFYNKIKLAVSSTVTEHDNNDDYGGGGDDKQHDDHQNIVQAHAQDQWNDQPLDMDAYAYWLQGWENVNMLRRIRQQWDEYLVDVETPFASMGLTSASKIPPVMVSPSPPSSQLWSRYLE